MTYLFGTNTEVTAFMRKLSLWPFLKSLRFSVHCMKWCVGGLRKALLHGFSWGLLPRPKTGTGPWASLSSAPSFFFPFPPPYRIADNVEFAWQRRVLFKLRLEYASTGGF